MADLTDIQSAQTVKLAGADPSTGVESNFANISSNGDVNVSDGLNNGGVYGNLSLTTANTAYEAKVGVNRFVGRKTLTVTPIDSDMYWGYDNIVTTSTGTPLFKNQSIQFSIDPDSTFQVWLVCAANSKNARITESP